MPEQTELIKRSFTRAADTYEANARIQDYAAGQLAEIFRKAANGREPERILEIGAGSGLLTRRLRGYFPQAVYTANDITDSFGREYARLGFRPFIGDAEAAVFPAQQDAVVSSSCFQWIKDMPRFLQKLADSLISDGILCFSTFGPDNFSQVKSLTGCGLDYIPVAEFKRMLESAGFRVQTCREEEDTLYFETVREMLRYFSATGVNGIRKTLWTPGRLEDFERRYRTEFSVEEGLPLTVDYLWIRAEKIR